MAGENQLSEFFDSFLFTKIFKSFRMAIQPTKLIIAFAAVSVLCLLGWIMDIGKTVPAKQQVSIAQIRSLPGNGPVVTEYPTQLHCYLAEPENVKEYAQRHSKPGQGIGVFATLWHFGSARFTEAVLSLFELRLRNVILNIWYCAQAVVFSFSYHLIYSIIYFAAALAVISVSGGAICRIAALQFARQEKPGLLESLKFSSKRFVSFFTAPLVPLGIIVVFGLCIFILGLIANIPRAGEIIMAIGLPAALFAAVLITLVVIGAAAGASLCFPAIGFEVTDGFDAVSRAFSYIYTRPWRMGFYTVIAMFYGAICYLFVRLFAYLTLFAAHHFLQLGVWTDSSTKSVNKLVVIWPEPHFVDMFHAPAGESAIWSEYIANYVVDFFLLVVFGLVVSFVISFYFSTNTIIYALMRKHVDDTALEDIYTGLEARQQATPADTTSQ